jgi:hypothetical protein
MAELHSTGQIVCKVVSSSQGWLKSDRSSRHFTSRPAYFCDYFGYCRYHGSVAVMVTSLTVVISNRLRLKCDGTCAETRFRLPTKWTSPFKSSGASVQSTTGSRGVRVSGNNAGYTMFRGSVKSTGYPLHSPVSPSLPYPCFTVCHHISTGLAMVSPFAHFLPDLKLIS